MQKKEENRARQKHISLHNVLSKNTYESIYTQKTETKNL